MNIAKQMRKAVIITPVVALSLVAVFLITPADFTHLLGIIGSNTVYIQDISLLLVIKGNVYPVDDQNGTVFPKATIFHNNKGLKDEIIIEGPLAELRSMSKLKEETIDELIEQTSIWVPQIYRDNWGIDPKCIIILEKKKNDNGMSEIRFGIAMKCTRRQPFECIKI